MNVTRKRSDLRLLTLTDESNFNIRMSICPLCWKTPELDDSVVVGKGTAHVCLNCARDIESLMREGGRQRRCSRHGCSKTFTGQGRGRYCSNACRQAAYRAR